MQIEIDFSIEIFPFSLFKTRDALKYKIVMESYIESNRYSHLGGENKGNLYILNNLVDRRKSNVRSLIVGTLKSNRRIPSYFHVNTSSHHLNVERGLDGQS